MLYRGRIAPSPTGLLHLGHAATFLVVATRARDAQGKLILRNDDLDQQRSRPKFYDAMIEDLQWLGLRWQEGPDIGGPHAPYSQSRREQWYRAIWQTLREGGWIYPCTCSRKDLAPAASSPHEEGHDEPLYPGTCRPGLGRAVEDPEADGLSWRFRVPDGEAIEFDDEHFGPQRFVAGCDFGDFLVWRRDGMPSYQLACVADDAEMGITEVVRGADLLKSTARQLLLYRALRIEPPLWFHCPLIRDAYGQRLAKRHDALAIRTLREQGKSREEAIEMIPGPHPELRL